MKSTVFSHHWLLFVTLLASTWGVTPVFAQTCSRPVAGSTISEPTDLRSSGGTLTVELHFRSEASPDGSPIYCYLYHGTSQSPTLRLHPGDVLKLTLFNDVEVSRVSLLITRQRSSHSFLTHLCKVLYSRQHDNCIFHESPFSWHDNFFHLSPGRGSPYCCSTARRSLSTMRSGIPSDAQPGLFWYHPHIHGFSNAQVLGGASGAIIIEGIEKQNPMTAGLPERVLVVRDQNLIHPDAKPLATSGVPQLPVLRDAEGDIMNTGTGGGKPARDLSLNFVPVSFPEYTPAVVQVQPDKRELWRLINASSITYLDLQLLVDNRPQLLGVVALDGAPLPVNPQTRQRVLWMSHILLPPAGRAEFLLGPLRDGTKGSFVTRTVDTGPVGENVPSRPLATLFVRNDAPPTTSAIPPAPEPIHSASAPDTQCHRGRGCGTHARASGTVSPRKTRPTPTVQRSSSFTVDGQLPPRSILLLKNQILLCGKETLKIGSSKTAPGNSTRSTSIRFTFSSGVEFDTS